MWRKKPQRYLTFITIYLIINLAKFLSMVHSSITTSHSAYVATGTESDGAKIDGSI